MFRFWLCVGLLAAFRVGGAELILDFSNSPLGQPPANFRSLLAGQGRPGEWSVIAETNAVSGARRFLAQLSTDETDERFPIFAYAGARFRDFTLTTMIKNVAGQAEQMAGVAFRGQDERNFYYVRLSSKGNSFRFFKVVGGERSSPIGPDLEIPSGVWHKLEIECKGNTLRFMLDGKEVIPPFNDTTFSSGWIGFLTKSDTVAYFGETRIVYTPQKTLAELLVEDGLQRNPRLAGLTIYGTTKLDPTIRILASTNPSEVGAKAEPYVEQVMRKDNRFYGLTDAGPAVTFPLHDRNGEAIGAVRVTLEKFFGQAEVSATAKAAPIVKEMERRTVKARDLTE